MWLEFVASRVTFDVLDCVELLGIALSITSQNRIAAERIHFQTNPTSTTNSSSRDSLGLDHRGWPRKGKVWVDLIGLFVNAHRAPRWVYLNVVASALRLAIP